MVEHCIYKHFKIFQFPLVFPLLKHTFKTAETVLELNFIHPGVSESKPNGHPHPVRNHLQDLQDGRYLQKGSGGGYGGHHDGYGGQNDEIRDHNDGYGGQLVGYGGQPGEYGDTLTVDDAGDNVSQSSWFRNKVNFSLDNFKQYLKIIP